jgi:hypothetical protein
VDDRLRDDVERSPPAQSLALPRLEDEVEPEPGAILYLGRMAAGHLFEAATFLRRSDGSLEPVRDFVGGLDDEAQAVYRDLLEIGEGGSGTFQEQLKHVRSKSFHYQALLMGSAEEREA